MIFKDEKLVKTKNVANNVRKVSFVIRRGENNKKIGEILEAYNLVFSYI